MFHLVATGSQLRSHAKRGAQFAAGRNSLDPLLLFERPLFVRISQAPAWLNAQKRAAIRPQRYVRNIGKIHDHPTSALRIHEGKLPPRNVRQFENDRTGQFLFRKRHFAAAKLNVTRFAREKIVRRKISSIQSPRHLQMKAFEGSRAESRMQSERDMRRQLTFSG
jgi:hypothetical protein